MSSNLLSRARRTIGLRLTLWYLAVFAVSFGTFFALAYASLSRSLHRQDREVIQEELDDYVNKYREGGIDELRKEMEENGVAEHVSGDDFFLVRLTGPEKSTVFLNIPEDSDSFDQTAFDRGTAAQRSRWSYLTSMDHKVIYEILSHPLDNGYLLQVGKSVQKRRAFLAHFRQVIADIMIPVILLGLGGGVFLTVRTLRPIHELIHAIRTIIQTGKTDGRVPTKPRGDELDELSQLFNTMLDRINALINGMKEGLDNVAHDLRTPMTRFRGIAEMALQSKQDGELIREALTDCVEEADRILTMLNTLMDISEAETGVMKLTLEKINIAELIREVVELYENVAEDKHLSVHVNVPDNLYVDGDRNRLRQIFANLLDNAIKYMPRDGDIDIDAIQHNRHIAVSVKDTGIGIPPNELSRIWDRLYRGDKSRSQRGLGLGLSLVKAIVKAHGGEVDVSSVPGVGSRFVIRIPEKL
jgi:heavy metal sensor kinase